ncbi:MAG: hypothetical protein ACJAVK_001513, partial [Akkermansiaceae bacterium]
HGFLQKQGGRKRRNTLTERAMRNLAYGIKGPDPSSDFTIESRGEDKKYGTNDDMTVNFLISP